jgi:peptidoglycan/xylan/chitin deacetylase (PgdA/CDA1 family)
VGRLSGPKNQVILRLAREVAPKVLLAVPNARFEIAGGPVGEEHRALQAENPRLSFVGFQSSLESYYEKATVVIGSGRVALEAMSALKPVVAIGEQKYIGPILPPVLEEAKATNFGDCFEGESFDWERTAMDLIALLKDPALRVQAAQTGHDLLKKEYNLDILYPRLEGIYRSVILQSNLDRFHEIPVLMYHRVTEGPVQGSKYNVFITKDHLRKHLDSLQARGFETVTFGDFLIRKLPKKPVVLTFDDGYEDSYRNLLPLLREHKMKAVVYALGDRKHKTNFWDAAQGEPEAALLSGEQIKEMAESGLVEIGAHSLSHRKLTELPIVEMKKEVGESKKALENLLGEPVLSFAYPYGDLNAEVKQAVREAGYTFGIGVGSGPTRFGADLMDIKRVHMFPDTAGFDFLKKTSGYYLRYRKLLGK